MLAAERTEITK